jgi:hypothetical protein
MSQRKQSQMVSGFLAVLLSTAAVACVVSMATVTGPDGNQWQTCRGNDAKCIAAIGNQCRNGYVLGYEKQFNCKPAHVGDSQCVTDDALEPLRGAKLNRVRGPDCRTWLMCRGFNDTGSFGNEDCLPAIGRECSYGYVVGEVFGEAMYQCKSSPDAGQPDAVAPTDAVALPGVRDSQ